MKTALVLTINNDHWLIPGGTPTDAGKLLGLLSGAVRVDQVYRHDRTNQETWEVKLYPEHPEYGFTNAKVEIVAMSKVRMPTATQEEPAREIGRASCRERVSSPV